MEEFILDIFTYLLLVLKTTALQLFFLLGPFFILVLIMNFISGISESLGYSLFGKRIYIYGFAWLGTALHELGHAIFAVIFGHKITQITLFSPNQSLLRKFFDNYSS